MLIKDTLNLRGEVLITGVDSVTGKTHVFVNDKNLIVLNGRQKLASLLLNGTGSHVSNIIFGTGGTATNNPTLPLPVDPYETALLSPLTEDPAVVTTPDSSASPRLTFTVILPDVTTYNGYGLNETALMLKLGASYDGAFAIKRFASINKSSSLTLKVTWTIYL